MAATLHVLRVFLGPAGSGGNPLGVFPDGGSIAEDARQSVAADLGFSETVFVDAVDDDGARIAIYTPARQLPFAGHPTVGTSWLLSRRGTPVQVLHVLAGDVATWQADDLTWIRGRPEWAFDIGAEQLASPADVEAIREAPPERRSWYPWAWIDEGAGLLRSRFFAEEVGIVEDEATGLAAVAMGGMLGRSLTIRQGKGSELYVRPGHGGTVEVGGRVVEDDVREYSLPT